MWGHIYIPKWILAQGFWQNRGSLRDIIRHEYGHGVAHYYPELIVHSPKFEKVFGGNYYDYTPSSMNRASYISEYATTMPCEDFAETFEQLREFMNDKLSSYHPQALTIIQTLFGLFIIVNKKYQFQIDQLDVKTIKLSHTKNNKNIVKFESEACSKEGTKYIRKIA